MDLRPPNLTMTPENNQILTPEQLALVEKSLRKRRRRFLLVSIPALAVLAAALGVSFADDAGTSTLNVSSSSNDFVFPVQAGTAKIPAAVTALKYTGTAGIDTVASPRVFTTSVIRPAWTPATGSAGEVTTAGDVVLVDATAGTLGTATALTLTIFVTNLTGLQQAYSSFAYPIRIWKCAATCNSNAAWSEVVDDAVITPRPVYLANTDGFMQFRLPVGFYYDVVFDLGGSFYTISTTITANLSPQFFFTAQPI